MTPQDLIDRYVGALECAVAAVAALPSDVPITEWVAAHRRATEAAAELRAAQLMLDVCRSHGL